MTTHRFAILEHTTGQGVHHDLLIEDPALDDTLHDDAHALRAWRVDPHPQHWATLETITLTPLPHHRRRYLTYEGPISADRGSVRRVAQGTAELSQSSDATKTLRLTIAKQPLTLTFTPTHEPQWIAKVVLA
ncbi:MAG: hypothetical protein AAGA29_07565 [Planctomycetota bacterium]